jgi:hypothetical protein
VLPACGPLERDEIVLLRGFYLQASLHTEQGGICYREKPTVRDRLCFVRSNQP